MQMLRKHLERMMLQRLSVEPADGFGPVIAIADRDGQFVWFVEAMAEIDKLKASLTAIRDSEYQNYEKTGYTQYGIGITDGHRYCAQIARDAIGLKE
jgi:hypothetical protein